MNPRLGAWLLVGSVIAGIPACGGSPGSGGTSTSRAAPTVGTAGAPQASATPPPSAVAAPQASATASPGAAGAPPAEASPSAGAPVAGASPLGSQARWGAGSEGPSEGAPNTPEALADARKRALKAAFHDVHEALLTYYAANSRYPRDRKELETEPTLAAAVARLEKVSTGLGYASDGGSFTLTVKRADGPPLTLTGNNQKFRRTPPPPAETPAGT